MTWPEFWDFYLQEHSRPATRSWHVTGTTLAFGCIIAALWNPWFLLGALAAGYGFAWISHAFVERNKPATFKHPLRSFAADWVMWAKALTGRLGPDLDRLGLSKR